MKRLLLIIAVSASFSVAAVADQVTLNIDAGYLKNSTGTAVVPNGMLLQLIASPSGTFSAPTSSSYITGDNVLLQNFSMNSNGGSGETLNGTSLTLSTTLTTGEAVLLRFYPSLSATSAPSAPTLGTTYGQVRSSTIESGQTDTSQAPWVIPASGLTVDLLYITATDGGSYSDASAYASNVVLPAAVPEPASVIQGGIAAGLLALCMWRRRSA